VGHRAAGVSVSAYQIAVCVRDRVFGVGHLPTILRSLGKSQGSKQASGMGAVIEDDAMERLLKGFWKDGFMIMPKVFAAEMITTVRAKIEADDESKRLKFGSIFKEVGSKTFDEFRKMAPLNLKAYKQLKDEATLLMKKFPMLWQPKAWVALKSVPGGEEQDPHRDFPAVEIGEARKKNTIQAGLIIGLTENTNLVLYPKCFAMADPRRRTEVVFGAGDCVVFRGDLIHCGASFTELNYRIHCVLTVKGIKWRNDVTEFAASTTYKCEFCSVKAPTELQVRNHQRGCRGNPDREANRARTRELNEKGKTCDVCKKHFAKRNTYYRHFSRHHKPY